MLQETQETRQVSARCKFQGERTPPPSITLVSLFTSTKQQLSSFFSSTCYSHTNMFGSVSTMVTPVLPSNYLDPLSSPLSLDARLHSIYFAPSDERYEKPAESTSPPMKQYLVEAGEDWNGSGAKEKHIPKIDAEIDDIQLVDNAVTPFQTSRPDVPNSYTILQNPRTQSQVELNIYTDGSIRSNRCGIGVVFENDESRNISETLPYSSNFNINMTELTAVLRALQKSREDPDITIWSDSHAVLKALSNTQRESQAGVARGLRHIRDECLDIIQARREAGHNTTIKYIKGHSGNPGNTAADRLAGEASKTVQEPRAAPSPDDQQLLAWEETKSLPTNRPKELDEKRLETRTRNHSAPRIATSRRESLRSASNEHENAADRVSCDKKRSEDATVDIQLVRSPRDDGDQSKNHIAEDKSMNDKMDCPMITSENILAEIKLLTKQMMLHTNQLHALMEESRRVVTLFESNYTVETEGKRESTSDRVISPGESRSLSMRSSISMFLLGAAGFFSAWTLLGRFQPYEN